MRITFSANLRIGVKHDDSANVFVGYAPALDIYSQGSSKSEAKRATESAVRQFISVAYDKGVLEQILKSSGFSQVQRGAGAEVESEYIAISEEEILEEQNFPYTFDVSTRLDLERVPA